MKIRTKLLGKVNNWISSNYQSIIICMLFIVMAIVIKQQYDLNVMDAKISKINKRLISEIEDAKYQLSDEIQGAKDELSSEIDGVKSTVRIWSN